MHAETDGIKHHLMFINYFIIVDVSIIILFLIMTFSILKEQNILLKILGSIFGLEVREYDCLSWFDYYSR